jgi:mono/diheme cytochrome c family protein
MKKVLFILTPVLLIVMAFGMSYEPQPEKWDEETKLVEVLKELGQPYPDHYMDSPSDEQIEMGKKLVYEGQVDRPGLGKSKLISKFYYCTDCHNQVREDPEPANPTPEKRLEYAVENNLRFLQSTTFWGMANRESWYNDDYILKYGALVEEATESLAASTQLCAQECSQGRELEQWELDAIIAYYWSLQLKLSDLELTDAEWKELRTKASSGSTEEAIALLKQNYMVMSGADFVDPPADKSKGYPFEGDRHIGEQLYEKSCQTCHRMYGPSSMILDDSKLTFKKLRKNLTASTKWSIYEIIRHGTYAQPGHRPYMPHYTAERMSDQQVEHLRAFIEWEAGS